MDDLTAEARLLAVYERIEALERKNVALEMRLNAIDALIRTASDTMSSLVGTDEALMDAVRAVAARVDLLDVIGPR